MPNHVINKVTITGKPKDVNKLFSRIKNRKQAMAIPSVIDFNKIIPMPKALDITSGGIEALLRTENSKEKVIETLKNTKQWSKKTERRLNRHISNKKTYGYTSWYLWACDNWGTKWNAYDISPRTNAIPTPTDLLLGQKELSSTFTFQTAWNTPEPIFEKLAEMFPQVEINVQYADEDYGSNCGEFSFKNGNRNDYNIEGDLRLFSASIWGDTEYEIEEEVA